MEEEAVRMRWLSGWPRRVLPLRRPAGLSQMNSYHAQWSVMDDQIMLTLPSTTDALSPSTVYLADLEDSLENDDDAVEFSQIAELPFHATRSRLLSNRAGFVTAEFRQIQGKLILRTHDRSGSVKREQTVPAEAVDGEFAVHGPTVALCVRIGIQKPSTNCLGTSTHVITWNTETGDLAKVEIPQDERAPQCHRGNIQFTTSSYIALGGHIDPCYDKPYAVLRSIPIAPSEQNLGRYFHHHENFEYGDDHDAIAIPGSSAHGNFVVHHHQDQKRFTVADVGLLTGEIPSEPEPTPRYFSDPDYHKDLFHVFSNKSSARTLNGATISDRLPALAGNRLLVRQHLEEYDHDADSYHGFKAPHSSFGTFQVLYLYDLDQDRCKALRQLSPTERQALEARLKELNPDARAAVVSRMFYASIEDEDDMERDASPEWEAHVRELWEVQQARQRGEATFPTLEFDDAPGGHDDDDARILFTRSMVCLPSVRDGEALALTTSAIVELPTPAADGYVHCFVA
ncbi:hypothetical protein BBK36DRAFT_1129517 [Trichoderma citrinoviride]|uniref:Uncharacterized protein n=1 Tax=Trichoderma citrinoviride TaxID=58853 RepID=A0A2T4AZ06_9HYPO|nr:hypothetical protein BBK36DRAFT_1129517 [Trichoderma citrinoviride]PTB62302.1 hypothetical protein BBK36DRAFT_1129517 [Trichoderma citrinoviride]